MREPAGRECRVDQLPNQPTVHQITESSKEKISLRERKDSRGLRFQYLAVCGDDVGFRVDGDDWQRVVQLHVALAERTAPADGREPFAHAKSLRNAGVERRS